MHDVTLARRLDRNPPLVLIIGRGECRNFRINLCTAPGTSSVVKTRTEMTDQQVRHTMRYHGCMTRTQPRVEWTAEKMLWPNRASKVQVSRLEDVLKSGHRQLRPHGWLSQWKFFGQLWTVQNNCWSLGGRSFCCLSGEVWWFFWFCFYTTLKTEKSFVTLSINQDKYLELSWSGPIWRKSRKRFGLEKPFAELPDSFVLIGSSFDVLSR